MHVLAALVTVLLLAVPSSLAFAQEDGPLAALVALQPLPEPTPDDIDAVLKQQWPAYYRSTGELGFGPDQIRAGRIDLDQDGRAELFILLDSPDWATDSGGPLMVARWTGKAWAPVGWSYAEAEDVYLTAERSSGWSTIRTPAYWLRWDGKAYRAIPRTAETPAPAP
ncbi:hypothetical protein [Magnetospirillum molischianum]|uniref:Uncharacterized protein n=1 Tax=Magnetospirillum molischianum DSM 120 TaxID=1150626 RepID=H8FW96_MAGML|nr:hypothetical protein [Magnetospirillum molischianum]CCG42634.1 conserved exported hypothetical protein [Magnetospirillum molischianum DSM 120]